MKKTVFLVALVLITLSGKIVAAAPPGQGPDGEEYIVQANDWLSKVAQKYYDDMFAYPLIVEATNAKAVEDDSFAVIDNPDLIEIGQKLWIPITTDIMAQPGDLTPAEVVVTEIPLAGPIADGDAEISGLTWYNDHLIMLPQYPNFFTETGDGFVFAIPKADIIAFLNGAASEPLEPIQIQFIAPGLQEGIAGFEGYEAIAFVGDNRVFITIESETDEGITGYLVVGSIAPDLSTITLDTTTLTDIQPQAGVGNMSEESLIVAGETVATIYEANGVGVNASPVAHLFDLAGAPIGTLPFPNIEYRITDVTELDSNDRFWAINYFFPGDEDLLPETDPIANEYGEGPTHSANDGVERLVEFQYGASGITLTDRPPLQLVLLEDALRNWEGLVRLDRLGFLLATDKFPQTILGFAPLPDNN